MESVNDKFSIDFKEIKKKLTISKSILTNNYLHSVKTNRGTLDLLETQYSTLQSSLEKKYNCTKGILIEIIHKNIEFKENCFAKVEKLIKESECSKKHMNNLLDPEHKKLIESLSNLSQLTTAKLNSMNPKTFDYIFELQTHDQNGYKVRWYFVDPADMVERPFIKTVERQLENGYLRDSCDHRLKLESGQIFAYADFNSMKLETLNPKSCLNLVRRE